MLRLPGQQLHLLLGLIQPAALRVLAAAACLCHLTVGASWMLRAISWAVLAISESWRRPSAAHLGILLADDVGGRLDGKSPAGSVARVCRGWVASLTRPSNGTNAGLQHLEMEIEHGAAGASPSRPQVRLILSGRAA